MLISLFGVFVHSNPCASMHVLAQCSCRTTTHNPQTDAVAQALVGLQLNSSSIGLIEKRCANALVTCSGHGRLDGHLAASINAKNTL